jgi:hypothetical protein
MLLAGGLDHRTGPVCQCLSVNHGSIRKTINQAEIARTITWLQKTT